MKETAGASRLEPGRAFPEISVFDDSRSTVALGSPSSRFSWRMVVVYRGRHCPICTDYLNALEKVGRRLAAVGIELVAVSGDTRDQLAEHRSRLAASFPIYHGLTRAQMGELGLYASYPRSEQESDHIFPEPALFVINEDGNVHLLDIANNAFLRPDLEILVAGLERTRDPKRDYPLRGTHRLSERR